MTRYLVIVIVLLDLWWVNNSTLIISPSTYPAKPPSVWLRENPKIAELSYKQGKVSGLDFPFYCGHWVHIKTLGYMGGFRDKKVSDYLGGKDGTNTWNRSLKEAWEYGIRYCIVLGRVYELTDEETVRLRE